MNDRRGRDLASTVQAFLTRKHAVPGWVMVSAGLCIVLVALLMRRVPQPPAVTVADRTPAAAVRVRGTMASVEESLAFYGYCFYDRRNGSFFHENLPIPPAQHRILIKPFEPSHLWMRFDLEADGTTIRSIRFGGNPSIEHFLVEVGFVAIQLNSELKDDADTSGGTLYDAIQHAADPVFKSYKTTRAGRWIVARDPGGHRTLQIVTIRRASGAE